MHDILQMYNKFMLWQTCGRLVQDLEATPLHSAVGFNNIDVAKVLLQHDADVDAMDTFLVRIQPQLWCLD